MQSSHDRRGRERGDLHGRCHLEGRPVTVPGPDLLHAFLGCTHKYNMLLRSTADLMKAIG
jgi:hypothetical protein